MKIIGKLFGFASILLLLNSCSGGYYTYDSYPYPGRAFNYNSPYYNSPYYYPVAPYTRGYSPTYVPVPYNTAPQVQSPSRSMSPGSPSMGSGGAGRRR